MIPFFTRLSPVKVFLALRSSLWVNAMTGHGLHVTVTKALSWGKKSFTPSPASVLFCSPRKAPKEGGPGKAKDSPCTAWLPGTAELAIARTAAVHYPGIHTIPGGLFQDRRNRSVTVYPYKTAESRFFYPALPTPEHVMKHRIPILPVPNRCPCKSVYTVMVILLRASSRVKRKPRSQQTDSLSFRQLRVIYRPYGPASEGIPGWTSGPSVKKSVDTWNRGT